MKSKKQQKRANRATTAIDKLFVQRETLECALSNCIPCLHKVFPDGTYNPTMFDINASKTEEFIFPPNQRPEMCPRSKLTKFTGLYNANQSVLTVGDGDFSFSLSIVEYFYKSNKSMVFTATSHESYPSVTSTYPSGDNNIQRLKQLGATVLHDVDATNLNAIPQLHNTQYDIIIWNFPCIRVTDGMDGQTTELEINRALLRAFFGNLHPYLTPTIGEVHVTHKTIEPFSWWDITTLAAENDMVFQGAVIFDKYNYPGYINRKVLDKKSFPSNDAQTYIFKSNPNATAAAVCDSGNANEVVQSSGVVCSDDNNADEKEGHKKHKKDKKNKQDKKDKKKKHDNDAQEEVLMSLVEATSSNNNINMTSEDSVDKSVHKLCAEVIPSVTLLNRNIVLPMSDKNIQSRIHAFMLKMQTSSTSSHSGVAPCTKEGEEGCRVNKKQKLV